MEQVAAKIGRGTWGHHANHSARIGASEDPMTVVGEQMADIAIEKARSAGTPMQVFAGQRAHAARR